MPTYACQVVITLHIDSNMYQLSYYCFFTSIIAQEHFEGTSTQFYAYQFYDNDRHNCYMLQLSIWVISNKNSMLFLRITNTCHIFTSAAGSWILGYTTNIILLIFFNILHLYAHMNFY